MTAGLEPADELGRYLSAQLVTLTALQSSFEADSSSGAYVVRSTPCISDDGRRYEPVPGGRPMRIYSLSTRA